jgi:hypothetical protein
LSWYGMLKTFVMSVHQYTISTLAHPNNKFGGAPIS